MTSSPPRQSDWAPPRQAGRRRRPSRSQARGRARPEKLEAHWAARERALALNENFPKPSSVTRRSRSPAPGDAHYNGLPSARGPSREPRANSHSRKAHKEFRTSRARRSRRRINSDGNSLVHTKSAAVRLRRLYGILCMLSVVLCQSRTPRGRRGEASSVAPRRGRARRQSGVTGRGAASLDAPWRHCTKTPRGCGAQRASGVQRPPPRWRTT